MDYILEVHGKEKLFHVNLLKRYVCRSQICLSTCDELSSDEVLQDIIQSQAARICVLDDSKDTELPTVEREGNSLDCIEMGKDLTQEQVKEVQGLLENTKVFSDKPGCTDVVIHEIRLKTNEAFHCKQYPVPVHLETEFDKEVQCLLDLGIIEPSNSPYCVPVVLIKKPDNTYRMALDFRALNAITIFDCEPMPLIDQDFYQFAESNYFTEIDITKAYYQIVLEPNSRKYTAFQTSQGLMQFKRMPFGLSTACASYVRLMRRLFDNIPGVSVYFDNILIFSKTWNEHTDTLQTVLNILGNNGLTAKASKSRIGLNSITYLGFHISKGMVSPDPVKCNKILDMERSLKLRRVERACPASVDLPFYRQRPPYHMRAHSI